LLALDPRRKLLETLMQVADPAHEAQLWLGGRRSSCQETHHLFGRGRIMVASTGGERPRVAGVPANERYDLGSLCWEIPQGVTVGRGEWGLRRSWLCRLDPGLVGGSTGLARLRRRVVPAAGAPLGETPGAARLPVQCCNRTPKEAPCGFVLVASPSGVAPLAAAQGHPQVREGFWIGFGFGYGSVSYSCSG